jgi:putative transposase
MLDFKNGTAAAITVGGKTISNLDDLAAYLAAQRGVSARTMWDWYTRFRKHGFAALADRLRSDKGKSRFFSKYPVAAEFAQNKFLNEQLSVELTHDALRREWPNLYNHGSQPPSYTTLRVYLNSLPRALRVMAREGEKAFNNNLRPFGIRDYNKLTANQLWVSDHMRHDVFVRNDLNLPGLKPDVPLRLWLTAFMDARTRKITGMAWCVNPSSESISSALRVGVSRFGIPREVLIDNGEDYKKVSKQIPLSPELNGVMARLGMKVRRALPYEPQAKPIESFFRTLHKRFDAKLAPFYCGPSPEHRPEECALVLKEHADFLKGKQPTSPLIAASEFIMHAAIWLTQDYNQHFEHSGHGMNGRTPDEVFDELLPAEQRQLPNREDLAPLFWERVKRTLREGGCVEIYNARYEPADPQSSARLQLHNAKEIIIACDPMNLGEAIAFDLAGLPRIPAHAGAAELEPVERRSARAHAFTRQARPRDEGLPRRPGTAPRARRRWH